MNNNGMRHGGGYLPWLDSLRFIAAFLVLLSHSRHVFFLPYEMLPEAQQGILSFFFYFVCRLGHEAVIAFFVISGFLVGGKGLEKILDNTFRNKDYVIDRSVRIGIPLITSIVFFLFACLFTDNNFEVWTAIGNLFSLQGILCEPLVNPFWSLSYEVWFYILLLGISLVASKRRFGIVIILICCLVFVKLDPKYLLVWFFGAFSYLCRPSKNNKCIQWLSFIAILITMALSIIASNSNAIEFRWKPNRDIITMFLAFSLCVYIQQIILCKPTKKIPIKIEQIFSYLAGFSYTLYLSHRITLIFIENFIFESGHLQFNRAGILSFLIILLICLVVSWGLYLISERYTYNVKKKVKSLVSIK